MAILVTVIIDGLARSVGLCWRGGEVGKGGKRRELWGKAGNFQVVVLTPTL